MSFFHPKKSKTDALLLIATLLFALSEFFGDAWTYYIQNSRCFALLGCNAGFFGYDAIIHVAGGIFFTALLIWLMNRHSYYNMLHDDLRKSAFVLLGIIACITIVWEVYEYILDYFGVLALHPAGSYIDTLAQPGPADTVGDMAFELLGSCIGILLFYVFDRNSLRKKQRDIV